MRFLDIGVAMMIGVSAVAGVTAWTPRSEDSTAARLAIQAHLRDGLTSYLDARGLPWLLRASPQEVCADLASTMARTGGVFVTIGAQTCGAPAPEGAVTSNLSLRLLPFEVSLVTWSRA